MKGWNKKKKKWFPHVSVEGGKKTIAYGHKLTASDDFKDGITDTEATKLLLDDIKKAHNDYKKGPVGVKKRMQWNYDKFKYYADSLKVYIVQSGDTLSSIAAKQPKGITAKTIALANNIDLDNPIIYPGQKLKIK